MTLIRRPAAAHACAPPTTGLPFDAAAGLRGDLWRCDQCGRLWRVTTACDHCHRYGVRPHLGMHAIFNRWRPATIRQKIANLRHGRNT